MTFWNSHLSHLVPSSFSILYHSISGHLMSLPDHHFLKNKNADWFLSVFSALGLIQGGFAVRTYSSEITNVRTLDHTCFSSLTMALNFLSGFLLLSVQLLFMGQMEDNLGLYSPHINAWSPSRAVAENT